MAGEGADTRALHALDQHLHGAVGQLEQLKDRTDRTDFVEICRGRVVLCRVLLSEQEDLLIVLHHLFESANGFFAADEEGHDHVGKHHDVAQGQDGISVAARLLLHRTTLRWGAAPAEPKRSGAAGASLTKWPATTALQGAFRRWSPRRPAARSRCRAAAPGLRRPHGSRPVPRRLRAREGRTSARGGCPP